MYNSKDQPHYSLQQYLNSSAMWFLWITYLRALATNCFTVIDMEHYVRRCDLQRNPATPVNIRPVFTTPVVSNVRRARPNCVFLFSYSINVENAHSGNIKMHILATVKCINWT